MKAGSVLTRDGYPELVTAVHDNFGPTYRGLRTLHSIGEILTKRLNHKNASKSTTGEDYSEVNFRVLRPVHVNSVRALLRKVSDARTLRLHPGLNWYEVHGD